MLYEGTQRIIELAKKSNACRILFTSSGAVYGSQQCNHINETVFSQIDTLNSESGLPFGKCIAEFLLLQASASNSIEVVVARCFSFVGPGIPMNLHYAIGNFIQSVLEERDIEIRGDGESIRSYLFLGDLIWWLLTILLDGRTGEVYNVGSDQPISILSLAHKIAEVSNKNPKIIIQRKYQNKGDISYRKIYYPSVEKIKNELKLAINTNLNDGIIKTYMYKRSQL
jgi:nucleoside-diphosphate-sugar epimerase